MAITLVPDTRHHDTGALLHAVRWFLLLLICADVFYILLHVAYLSVPALRGARYSLETDGGLAEFYQYVKQLWLALCLAAAFVQRRQLIFLVWSGFFGFLLVDDALSLHEHGGAWLGRHLALPAIAGLRPDDFGELMVAAAVGGSLLLLLALSWWRDRKTTWRLSRDLLALTLALGVCGVLLDQLHVIAYFKAKAISDPLAVLEDGGELLIVSAMTAYAVDLAVRGTAAPAGLRQLVFGDRRAGPPHVRLDAESAARAATTSGAP